MARPILLAVDDDVNVLEAVVQDLRRNYGAEYRVMRAANGQAALDTLSQVKAREEPVALLLSDQRASKQHQGCTTGKKSGYESLFMKHTWSPFEVRSCCSIFGFLREVKVRNWLIAVCLTFTASMPP